MEANQNSKLENEMAIVVQAKTDDQAFSFLYEYYFPKIYYFILKRVGHKEAAEDLVSGVFLKVFGKLKSFKVEHEMSFKAWIYRIATNSLTDYYRRQSRKSEVDLDSLTELADVKDAGEEAAGADDAKLVRTCLADLPPRDREILELKFFAELSNLEIAETRKISANNAGVLIYRALKKFKENYQKYAK